MNLQELNAAVKAHAEGLDAALMTLAAPQLHDMDSSYDSSGSLTQEGQVGQLEMLQGQMTVTEGRLVAAITARERVESLLQASNERSALLEARSLLCCDSHRLASVGPTLLPRLQVPYPPLVACYAVWCWSFPMPLFR